jgi:hypothetical protein
MRNTQRDRSALKILFPQATFLCPDVLTFYYLNRQKEDETMSEENKKICPQCEGKKVIPGTCSCNMEWRGTKVDDEWEDCQCSEKVECPTCHGTGYAEH